MISTTLLNRLDLFAATRDELASTTALLPLRSDQQALVEHVSDLETFVRASLSHDGKAHAASVVFASKQKGTRPLNIWRLQDRIYYRALVALLSDALPPGVRERIPYSEFVQKPILNHNSHYISTTDISSFYVFIDHAVLADELIAQTADFETVSALLDLLFEVMGRRIGIPQVHDSSDVLGDTYIDPIRRTLRRVGYDSYTYSDDFRIGTETLGQARAALELCASAAREIGLVLNEAKTFTYGRDRYLETLETRSEAEKRILEDEELDEVVRFLHGSADGYKDRNTAVTVIDFSDLDQTDAATTEDEKRTEEDVQQAALALKVWSIWEDSESENQRSFVVRHLLSRALPALGDGGNYGPLSQLDELLRSAPDLTPRIAKYLTNLGSNGPLQRKKIRVKIAEVVEGDALSEWQKIWLASVVGNLRRPRNGENLAWLIEGATSGSPSLIAYAADAIGRLRLGSSDVLRDALDLVGDEFRPPVIWALGRLGPSEAKSVSGGLLDRLLLPSDS